MVTTIETYIERLIYEKTYPKDGPDPLDLLGEKFYYGKVDSRLNSVYIPDSAMQFHLGQLSAKEPLFAVNFVADAFNAMKSYFIKAASTQKSCQTGFLMNLEAKKAWVSPSDRFVFHQDVYFELFHEFLFSSAQSLKILNFHDYLTALVKFAVQFGSRIPLTRTGFIKSKYYSFYSTGLVIDIGEEDYNNEAARKKYISDPNFNFFRKAARRHGFLVDKFAPWRLIADISSYSLQRDFMVPQPIYYHNEFPGDIDGEEVGSSVVAPSGPGLDAPDYGLKFNPGTATNYFEVYCMKSHVRDIIELKIAAAKYYNQFVKERPVEKKTKVGTSDCKPILSELFTRSLVEEPTNLSLKDLQIFQKYSNNFWLESYFKIRLTEEDIKISDNRYKHILKLNKKQLKYHGMQKAIANINRTVNLIKGEQTDPRFCQNYDACGDLKIFGGEKIKFGLTSPQQYGYTTSTIQTATFPEPTGGGTTGGGMGGGY